MAIKFDQIRSLKKVWLRTWIVLSVAWCALEINNSLPLTDGAPALQELEAKMHPRVSNLRQRCTQWNFRVDLDLGKETETLCFSSRNASDTYFKWLGQASNTWHTEHKRQKALRIAGAAALPPILLALILLAIEWIFRGAGKSLLFSSRVNGNSVALPIHKEGVGQDVNRPVSHTNTKKNNGPRTNETQISNPGVHGWLKLFCILLTIVFPLYAVNAFSDATGYQQSIGYASDPISGMKFLVAAGSGIMALWSFLAGAIIWRGSASGKRIALIFLCAYPVIAGLTALVASMPLGGETYGFEKFNLVLYALGKLAFSLIWITYFMRSRRVKMLYGSTSD